MEPPRLVVPFRIRMTGSSRLRHRAHSSAERDGQARGQVLVLFVLSIFVLLGLVAVVIDISWYWANSLRVQRAADAAALAGVVDLPGNVPQGITDARSAATQNGYTAGRGVVVTPIQDPQNDRRMDVTISAPVGTFFMRIFGINSLTATRTAKAEYVLPVPMGSPLAYYGLGDFYVVTGSPPVTSVAPYTSVPASGNWGTPNNGWTTGSSYATSATNNQQEAWSNLNVTTGSLGTTITGLTVAFDAKVSSGSSCKVKAELSWNNGGSWGSAPQTTSNLTGTDTVYTLGSASSSGTWDSGHAWAAGDFANGKLQVRLTYVKGSGCGTVSVNHLVVTVYTSAIAKNDVRDPLNNVLASQGGWGAILTKGGNEQNGDAYSPANNGGGSGFNGGANALYNGTTRNGGGYLYVVNLPAGGTVAVFDPGFCAMGGNPSGAGNLGAGDHWVGGNTNPVSTYYTLWNTNGNLGLGIASWSQVYASGSLFARQTAGDTTNGGPSTSNGTDTMTGCDTYHDRWWTIPSGALGAGTYVLQVATTNPNAPTDNATGNNSTNAENMFAIEALGNGGSPTVYGNGKMAVYNNLQPGNSYQLFYLAKIDQATGAGKTALIDIFDPGDVPGNAVLKILSPNGGSQSLATFSYTTDANCNVSIVASGSSPSDSCSGTNVTQITTSVNGHSSFNNTWIHIRIPMPGSYGSAGLWQGGWWQIRYETPGGGNDTTTWQVSVSGNPVHLVVP